MAKKSKKPPVPTRTILLDKVPEKLYEQFQALAYRKGKTMVGYLREILSEKVFEDEWINQGGNFNDELGITPHNPHGQINKEG